MFALGWGWFKHVENYQHQSQRQDAETIKDVQASQPVQPLVSPSASQSKDISAEVAKPASEFSAMTLAPSDTTTRTSTVSEALSLIDRGRTQEGVALLLRLASLDTNNTEILMELAMAYSLDLKDPAKARMALEQIIEINPNYRAALNELELVYGELGAYDQGLAFLDLKIQQNPNSLELQFLYGRMLASSNPKASISWLKNATKIIDIRENALNQLAIAALKSGDIPLAIESWAAALALAEAALAQAVDKGEPGIDFLEDRIASTKIDLEKARKQSAKNL